MFNSENATKNIPVKVTLIDGTVQMGSLIISLSSDLSRTLNGDTRFVEFEGVSGARCFFASHSLCQVTPINIPVVKKLEAGTDSNKDFNPYRVLNISPGVDAKTVQEAYYKMAKQYHPDRFSGVELPVEMARYADNMSRLVNAAFQVINNQADQLGVHQPPGRQNVTG